MDDSSSQLEQEDLQLNVVLNRLRNRRIGQIGNCLGLFFNDKGHPFLTIGPHWQKCVCFLIIFEILDLFILFIFKMKVWIKVIGGIISLFFLLTFLSVTLVNPGIQIEQEDIELQGEEERRKVCKRCNILQYQNSFHCDQCDLCVEQFDHHCPWTGKCIGKNNQKCFNWFLLGVLANTVYCTLVYASFMKKA